MPNNASTKLNSLHICNHEDADTHLLLHALDASTNGCKSISIVTTDTDVVIIALYYFFDLNVPDLS